MHTSPGLALSVRGLSKSYRIAHNEMRPTRVAEAIMLALHNIGKTQTVETFWALQDVSFDIQEGDVVGIIGRNGAGKSTLLKILSRIVEPDSGQIDIYGRVGSLLEVGTGFHPDLTGRENIYLNGAVLGMSRREITKHFDAIVDFAGTEKFLDTPVKRYSSGMYVRLAFAVAAHLEPEILIVDEVLAVGDAAFQKKCLGKMQDVASHGRTVIFVSHNMGPIRSMCRRVIWMSQGRVLMQGEARDVVDAYLQDTLAATTTQLDLRLIPRPSGMHDQAVLVCKVEFNGGGLVQHGEPLAVRIEYEAQADAEEISVGFGFCSLDGARLMSLDSDLQDDRWSLHKGEHGVAEAFIAQLHLQPGLYLLDVGVRSGDYHGIDFLPGCAQIEVLPGPTTPNMIIRNETGVRMPAAWRLTTNADGEVPLLPALHGSS